MIQTFSKFYYGHTIDTTNNYIDFKEGSDPAVVGILNVGSYSLTDFAAEVQRVLDDAGDLEYTVAVNRTTRIITVSATGAFTLLASTGDNVLLSCYDLLGFSTDTSSATSHIATSASGFEWKPQYKIQDYVSFYDQQDSYDSISRMSANGVVEAVKFGLKYTMDANFRYITDYQQGFQSPIETQVDAVDNARDFMVYATTKADLEFIPDRDVPATFNKCFLDLTPDDRDGLGFKLKELYTKNLPGYYETGVLKFIKR